MKRVKKVFRRLGKRFSKTVWKKVGIIGVVTVIFTAAVFFLDRQDALLVTEDGTPYLERNSYGEGDRQETLTVKIERTEEQKNAYGDVRDSEEGTVTIDIHELEYEPQKVREVLKEAGEKLEDLILGENESLELVRSDLNLVSKVPETAIEVAWEMSDYTVMDITGKLNTEALKDDGTVLEVTAVLAYGQEVVRHTFPVCVYPPQLSDSGKILSHINDTVEATERDTRTSGQVVLPTESDGMELIWQLQREPRSVWVLVLGAAAIGLVFAQDSEKNKKKKEERNRQMLLDYPGIVDKLTIYIGAGMTVRNAWGRMVRDYKENPHDKGVRYAYEEMALTWHELGDGVSERDCYENFGERCRLQPYMKLGALLAQNLRKGSKGLSEILRLEAINAMEERKAAARRQGEEAGTKLLLPMFMMLSVVLAIVVIPAFLSIQM